MKEWKTELINDICKAAAGTRIVSLKETAAARGITHISAQGARDILTAVKKALPEYRPVRMMKTPNDSLFQSLCFIEKGVEFDDGSAFLQEV